ncbi:MAG: FAD-dependent oxidoreductase [Balneola sp.]
MPDSNYDYCILGAGLAGLTLAKELVEQSNTSVLVVDPNGIGGGASGSPIGLVNPATGRYATKTWRAEQAVTAIKENLQSVSNYADKPFYSEDGVIRPALDTKIAQRMKENVQSSEWPGGWCIWLEESDIIKRYPGLTCVDGGVWVSCGMTVQIPSYLNALAHYLKTLGVDFVENREFELIEGKADLENDEWTLSTDGSESIKIDHLIVAAGIKTKEFDFLSELPLHAVKGQVVVYKCDKKFPYGSAVSALGYFASLDTKTFVAGSTYEHNFEHEETDIKGLNYIQDRLFRVMPQLKGHITSIDQWSGVRASTPDRMPIIGQHPTIKNCSVFCGLGSKGLLYSSLLAKDLAKNLIDKEAISQEVSISRFLS